MSGFMRPEITAEEDWLVVETEFTKHFLRVKDVGALNEGEAAELLGEAVYSVEQTRGFGIRMNAPGYMDQTDWSVFPNQNDAKEFLIDFYEAEEEDIAEI